MVPAATAGQSPHCRIPSRVIPDRPAGAAPASYRTPCNRLISLLPGPEQVISMPAIELPPPGPAIVVVGTRQAAEHTPNTKESADAAKLRATTNVRNAEDALRYFPSLVVRKRHIGDTQAPLATRTSGVGASARSLIYADGVLLSALIGNNNSFASPRWGMVAPEEIDRGRRTLRPVLRRLSRAMRLVPSSTSRRSFRKSSRHRPRLPGTCSHSTNMRRTATIAPTNLQRTSATRRGACHGSCRPTMSTARASRLLT